MKAIFKLNGGLGALLCSKCRIIIKTEFTDDERKSIRGDMPAQYCKTCMQEVQTRETNDRLLQVQDDQERLHE